SGISLTSVGSPIEITIPSLPEEIMAPPVKFLSFVVGENYMQTHIVDRSGNDVLIDGKVDQGSNEFFLTKEMLLLISSFKDDANSSRKGGDEDNNKEGEKKYRVLKDNNNNRCTIDFMGGDIGGRTEMGVYDTIDEARAAMARMYADGRCGVPPDP